MPPHPQPCSLAQKTELDVFKWIIVAVYTNQGPSTHVLQKILSFELISYSPAQFEVVQIGSTVLRTSSKCA